MTAQIEPFVGRSALICGVSSALPSADLTSRIVQDSARSIGLHSLVLHASASREIDAAFASLAQERVDDVLFVAADGFFQSRGEFFKSGVAL